MGCVVEAASASGMRVRMDVRDLGAVSAHPDVARIRLPIRPDPHIGFGSVVAQGVSLTAADILQSAQFDGSGINVAVIDVSFGGLSASQDAGELPVTLNQVDFSGLGFNATSNHGVNVAEILLDMAPSASLSVLKIGDSIDFENAVEWANLNGIDVGVISLGFAGLSYYDDTGPVNEAINDSTENHGVFWAVSSGNYAESHWRGGWTDVDADDILEFDPGVERNLLTGPVSEACVFLNWNQYGLSSKTDLDLFVYRSDGSVLDSSTRTHPPGVRPVENLCIDYDEAEAPYEIEVRRISGSTVGLDMTLLTFNHDFASRVVESSMIDPASARGSFTVGAIQASRWSAVNPPPEFFSSQGPTNDGRVKPDLMGPDRVRTSKSTSVTGTSFASPHVGGAAALVLAQEPTLGPEQVAAILESVASDIGAAGKDAATGSGRLVSAPLPAFDSDLDLFPDSVDVCPYISDPSQVDEGQVGGAEADGIGNACQCGDLTLDGAVLLADWTELRSYLAVRGAADPLCNVFGPADGGASDCDAVDAVVLRRAVSGLPPGVLQNCSPSLPLP